MLCVINVRDRSVVTELVVGESIEHVQRSLGDLL
jgi:hypothetical protein